MDKLQRWRYDSGSTREDPPSLKGHTDGEQEDSMYFRVQGDAQSIGV